MAKKLSDIIQLIESSPTSFLEYLKENFGEDTLSLLNALGKENELYIFSGIIRNFFLGIPENRDIDIVLKDKIDIDSFFSKNAIEKNSFGGYKIHSHRLTFDVWFLDNTWAFKFQPRLFELEKHIPDTAFFNFSSISFSFNERKFIYSVHFLRFLRDRKMDVVYKPNANYSLCVVNTFYYSEKYQLKINAQLLEYVLFLHDKNKFDYERTQIKHFGRIVYTNQQIIDKLNKERRYLMSREE